VVPTVVITTTTPTHVELAEPITLGAQPAAPGTTIVVATAETLVTPETRVTPETLVTPETRVTAETRVTPETRAVAATPAAAIDERTFLVVAAAGVGVTGTVVGVTGTVTGVATGAVREVATGAVREVATGIREGARGDQATAVTEATALHEDNQLEDNDRSLPGQPLLLLEVL